MSRIKNRCPGCERAACDGCGIFREMGFERGKAGGAPLRKLNTNKQVQAGFPDGFVAEVQEGLGVSFDVGTTTLAGMLWDLREGRFLGAETASNPQAVFGADVIRRIQAARDEEKLQRMQKLLTGQLDEMARRMLAGLEEKEAERRGKGRIRQITVAGNTAMCEILLGIQPEGLFGAPFTPDYDSTVQIRGKELGFDLLGEALVMVLPPIGGYVGSDALAVYGYVAMQEHMAGHAGARVQEHTQEHEQKHVQEPGALSEKRILAVDIGTNGEILLQCGERKYACSAAAGPALEGGAIRQGMRAAEGAIDMVSAGGRFPVQDLVYRVVGGTAPKGICGSGLVDTLALLWKEGILDSSGYMRSAPEAKAAGVPERLCRRIREEEKGRCFLLTDEKNPVFFTAEDVRQLQLSVSALRSGMEILLKKAGLEASQLDRIYLAGAFGCCIRTESAVTAGLLPGAEKGRIIQAGNLAGTGAAMALLSPKVRREIEADRIGFEHVELAQEACFEEIFLKFMNFFEER